MSFTNGKSASYIGFSANCNDGGDAFCMDKAVHLTSEHG